MAQNGVDLNSNLSNFALNPLAQGINNTVGNTLNQGGFSTTVQRSSIFGNDFNAGTNSFRNQFNPQSTASHLDINDRLARRSDPFAGHGGLRTGSLTTGSLSEGPHSGANHLRGRTPEEQEQFARKTYQSDSKREQGLIGGTGGGIGGIDSTLQQVNALLTTLNQKLGNEAKETGGKQGGGTINSTSKFDIEFGTINLKGDSDALTKVAEAKFQPIFDQMQRTIQSIIQAVNSCGKVPASPPKAQQGAPWP